MKMFLRYLFRPDFMQILLISVLLFLLPLKHRPRWKRNAVCLILPCVVLGSSLQMYFGAMSEHFTAWHFFFLPYYLPPLLCGWLLFRVCTTLSVWETIYGAACAYAAQHIAFCVTTILSDIVGRYGGLVRVQTDEDIFILSVLLPLPQKEAGT